VSGTVPLDKGKYRLFIAIQYLNASEAIFEGLQRQQGVNNFHFLITLRSFIEYTRRGIWFLVWASSERLVDATKLTFSRPRSPALTTMDVMLNEALGKGKVSALTAIIPEMNEPFVNCLHALTHGSPLSVRMIAFGLDKIFDTAGFMARAQADLNIFRILLYRRMLDEKQEEVWKMLSTIHNSSDDLSANARIAAHLLKQSGKAGDSFKNLFNPEK
jgi:hypothetical protein